MRKFINCFLILFLIVFSLILFADVNSNQSEVIITGDIVQVGAVTSVNMIKFKCEKQINRDSLFRLQGVREDKTIISLTKVNDDNIKVTARQENRFIKHFMNLKFPSS